MPRAEDYVTVRLRRDVRAALVRAANSRIQRLTELLEAGEFDPDMAAVTRVEIEDLETGLKQLAKTRRS
jgi:hypothetical protein